MELICLNFYYNTHSYYSNTEADLEKNPAIVLNYLLLSVKTRRDFRQDHNDYGLDWSGISEKRQCVVLVLKLETRRNEIETLFDVITSNEVCYILQVLQFIIHAIDIFRLITHPIRYYVVMTYPTTNHRFSAVVF